jgi:hypothetical protein
MVTPLIDSEQLDRYFEKLESHIGTAEKHLGLAHGTLGDLLVDSDYITILKISSTIEPLLNELLEKNVTHALSHPKVAFPGGDALADFVLKRSIDDKRTLALKFELISLGRANFIKSVSTVRNFYAHNIKNLALSMSISPRRRNHPTREDPSSMTSVAFSSINRTYLENRRASKACSITILRASCQKHSRELIRHPRSPPCRVTLAS